MNEQFIITRMNCSNLEELDDDQLTNFFKKNMIEFDECIIDCRRVRDDIFLMKSTAISKAAIASYIIKKGDCFQFTKDDDEKVEVRNFMLLEDSIAKTVGIFTKHESKIDVVNENETRLLKGTFDDCKIFSRTQLQILLSNGEKVGGDDTLDIIEYEPKPGFVIFSYKSSIVTDKVLEKCENGVTIKGKHLEINLIKDESSESVSKISEIPHKIEHDESDNNDEINSIMITLSDKEIDIEIMEVLELYFESPKKGGGKLKETVKKINSTKAKLVFEDKEIAEYFINKKTININGININIEPITKEKVQVGNLTTAIDNIDDINSLMISWSDKEIDMDTLELYFESPKKGGGKLKEPVKIIGSTKAELVFENKKIAEYFINKKTIAINGININIESINKEKVQVGNLTTKYNKLEMVNLLLNKFELKDAKDLEYWEERKLGFLTMGNIKDANELIARQEIKYKNTLVTFNRIDLNDYEAYKQNSLTHPFEKEELQESNNFDVRNACMIRIACENINEVDPETLELKLQSKQISNEEELVNFEIHKEDDFAIGEYSNPDIAKIVASKKMIKVSNKECYLSLIYNDENADCVENNDAYSYVVEVSNILDLNKKEVKEFFEDREKSDGGDIDDIYMFSQRAVVEFKDMRTSQRVVNKYIQKCKGNKMKCNLLFGNPCGFGGSELDSAKNVCIIREIPLTVNVEKFNLLIAKYAKSDIKNIIFSPFETGLAILIFQNDPNLSALQEHYHKKSLKGHMIKIERVEKFKSLLFEPVSDTNEAVLELLMQNSKKSGGDENAKLKLLDLDVGVVEFESHEIALRVLTWEKGHVTKNKKLNVIPFLKNFSKIKSGYDFSKPLIITPTPVYYENYVNFLSRSKVYKVELSNNLKECDAKLIIDQKLKKLRIECTIDFANIEANILHEKVTGWKTKVEETLDKFVSQFSSENIEIIPALWKSFCDECRNNNVDLKNMCITDKLLINVLEEKYIIQLSGLQSNVDEQKVQYDKFLKNVNEKMEREKQIISAEVPFKSKVQLKFLLSLSYVKDLNKNFPGFKYDIIENIKMNLTGLPTEVNEVKLKILEEINKCSLQHHKFEMKEMIDILNLNLEELKKRIKDETRSDQIFLAFNEEDCMIEILSTKESDVDSTIEIVRKFIGKCKINLSEDQLTLLKTVEYESFLQNLQTSNDYGRKFSIESFQENNAIIVIALNDILYKIKEEIQLFLSDNTHCVISEPISKCELYVLSTFFNRSLADKIADNDVKISINKKEVSIEFIGTQSDCNSAKITIREFMKKNIVSEERMFSSSADIFVFSQKDNAELIKKHGKNHNVWLEIKKRNICGTNYDCKACHNGLHFIREDITSLKDVDVVVNAANCDLKHSGGLAALILKKGGNSIQLESEKWIAEHGKLKAGMIAVTNGGNLSCKFIFHAVAPTWNDGKNSEEVVLYEAYTNCFKEAENRKLKSIAFPLLGAGSYSVPVINSAGAFFDAFRDCNLQSVSRIYLTNLETSNMRQICATMQKSIKETIIHDKSMGLQQQAIITPMPKKHVSSGQVVLCKQSIIDVKSDVIVNTTGKNLKLDVGYISNLILNEAGSEIQKECTDKYPSGIEYGDLVVTRGYNLRCKYVFHGSFYPWKESETENILRSFLIKCFNKAKELNAKRISIPPLGTGNLKYPPEIVANCIIEESKILPDDFKVIIAIKPDKSNEKTIRSFENVLKFGITKASTDIDDDDDNGKWLKVASSIAKFNQITVKVVEGDLTEAETDAIVNSTDKNIDLNFGAVAQSILRKAGQDLQRECSKVIPIKEVYVTPGFNLKSKFIVHLVVPEDTDLWTKRIRIALEAAQEAKNVYSISIPALGTGEVNTKAPSLMANKLYDAIEEFAKSGGRLRQINVVIFNKNMIKTYTEYLIKRCKKQFSDKSSVSSEGDGPVIIGYTAIDNKAYIDKAFCDLQTEINNLYDVDTFYLREHPEIKVDNNELVKIAKQFEIKIDFIEPLRLSGLKEKVAGAKDQIIRYISNLNHEREDNIYGSFIRENVAEWQWEKDKKTFISFNQRLTCQLETAYKQFIEKKDNVKSLEFKSFKKNKYVVHFDEAGNHYQTDEQNVKVKVKRISKYDEKSAVPIPSNWSKNAITGSYHLEKLDLASSEAKNVEKQLRSTAGNTFSQIISIERVENVTLYTKYCLHREYIEKRLKKKVETYPVWHGTDANTISSICQGHFNRSYAGKNATAYGVGVYFAKNAQYSLGRGYAVPDHNNHKRLFLCRIISGDYCVGNSSIKQTPTNPNTNLKYDSTVDNVQNPSIYVIYHDDAGYPEYIFTVI